jgi:hypothetical protein
MAVTRLRTCPMLNPLSYCHRFSHPSTPKTPFSWNRVSFPLFAAGIRACDVRRNIENTGAGEGSRTPTRLPSVDFESTASAIPPHRHKRASMVAGVRSARQSLPPTRLRHTHITHHTNATAWREPLVAATRPDASGRGGATGARCREDE